MSLPDHLGSTSRTSDRNSSLLDAALACMRVWLERDSEESRENFTRYAGYEGFLGIVACDGDEAVGVGYGARSKPGICGTIRSRRSSGLHPALQDAWRLVELAVVPTHQGLGIGGRLHDMLLLAQSCPRVLLCTASSNERARSMYEKRGWHYVDDSFQFAGQPHLYAIMGLRTSSLRRSPLGTGWSRAQADGIRRVDLHSIRCSGKASCSRHPTH
ncbi:MAG: GNAT family N-acetyltransferase [Thermomicrobiales bacterium]